MLGALTVFWIEALTAHTNHSPESDLREFVNLAAALVPTLTFVAGCALATLWCVADQRKRCPVCLSRLALPVTLGSWSSSLLDPVTTEFVCERGHGSLAMPETDASSAERDGWTGMDEFLAGPVHTHVGPPRRHGEGSRGPCYSGPSYA